MYDASNWTASGLHGFGPDEEGMEQHRGIDLTTPSSSMALALFVIALALLLASAGGIGGGGILVPLFIMAFGWTPRYAIPLSNITIFAGGLMNTLVNLQKRHPNVDRPMIVSGSPARPSVRPCSSTSFFVVFPSLFLSSSVSSPLAVFGVKSRLLTLSPSLSLYLLSFFIKIRRRLFFLLPSSSYLPLDCESSSSSSFRTGTWC